MKNWQGLLMHQFFGVMICSGAVFGADDPKELIDLRFKYEVHCQKVKSAARESNLEGLKMLRDSFTRANELQSAQLTVKAIEGIPDQTAELPPRLTDLLERQEAALNRKLDPLRRIYRKELSKLKREFTQKADLDGALAVDNELAALAEKEEKKNSGIPTTKAELADWLTGTEWKVVNGMPGTFCFVDNGNLERRTGSGSVAFSTTYLVEDRNHIEYKTPKGDRRRISFEEDFKSFDHLVEQNGVRFTVELIERGGSKE